MDMHLRKVIARQLDRAMREHKTLNSQSNLAKKSGVGQTTIGRILRQEVDVRTDNLKALGDALGKPPHYFFYDADLPAKEAEWVGDFDPWDDETPVSDDEVELPLFKEVELAAGVGTQVVAENNGNKLRFAKRTLSNAGVDPSAAACARVAGRIMEPVLFDGTTVGVDTSKTAIKDGDMYAIDHDGMLQIKLLYRLPGNCLKIVSYNKDEWPDEHLSAEDACKVRVIGRVFWWSTLR